MRSEHTPRSRRRSRCSSLRGAHDAALTGKHVAFCKSGSNVVSESDRGVRSGARGTGGGDGHAGGGAAHGNKRMLYFQTMSQKKSGAQFRNVPPSKIKHGAELVFTCCLLCFIHSRGRWTRTRLCTDAQAGLVSQPLPPPALRKKDNTEKNQLENSFGAIFMAYFQFTVTAAALPTLRNARGLRLGEESAGIEPPPAS